MSQLITGVQKWLDYTGPLVEAARTYTRDGDELKHYFELIKRAAVVRQTEALTTMLKMTESEHGHFAATLLRPAYEELIWIEYLNKHPDESAGLASELCLLEVSNSITAQNDFAGPTGMNELGFNYFTEKENATRTHSVESRIRVIGKKLNWKLRGGTLPSMAWLSQQVGRQRDHEFLYHATSRYVHFSVQELARRVLGTQGKISIGSTPFSDYWQTIALYWGTRLNVDLLFACADILGEKKLDAKKREEVAVFLKEFAQVPIITTQELKSWS
jgi:hypothetical protein